MTSLAHPAYAAQDRAGVARINSTPGAVPPVRENLKSSKGLAAILLAAVVAALLAAANQMVDNWSDGNLLAAWVILWAVGFAALGLCAGAARKLAVRAVAGLDAWSQRVALARADARYLALAKEDPRIMADLQRALDQRSDDQVPSATTHDAAMDRYTGWFSHYMNQDGRGDEYETRPRAGGVWLSRSW
ncbi:MAG: hypothetical protein ABI040_05755 [Rhodoferax sp.]